MYQETTDFAHVQEKVVMPKETLLRQEIAPPDSVRPFEGLPLANLDQLAAIESTALPRDAPFDAAEQSQKAAASSMSLQAR